MLLCKMTLNVKQNEIFWFDITTIDFEKKIVPTHYDLFMYKLIRPPVLCYVWGVIPENFSVLARVEVVFWWPKIMSTTRHLKRPPVQSFKWGVWFDLALFTRLCFSAGILINALLCIGSFVCIQTKKHAVFICMYTLKFSVFKCVYRYVYVHILKRRFQSTV